MVANCFLLKVTHTKGKPSCFQKIKLLCHFITSAETHHFLVILISERNVTIQQRTGTYQTETVPKYHFTQHKSCLLIKLSEKMFQLIFAGYTKKIKFVSIRART